MRQLESDLNKLSKKALPFAIRNTLNDVAFVVMPDAKATIDRKMTLRNRWTLRNVRVGKVAGGMDIDKMRSTVGSPLPYLAVQEEGGTEVARGKHGVPIPTSYAAGQEGAQPRTRLVRKANRLANIVLPNRWRAGGSSTSARLVRAAHHAIRTGQRYIYAEFRGGKGKGIYKVVGGRRNNASGWPQGAKLKMIHSLDHKVVKIPPRPWLIGSTKRGTAKINDIYIDKLLEQIRRHHIFPNLR